MSIQAAEQPHGIGTDEESEEASQNSEDNEIEIEATKPLEELGGIIIYDSQARLVGCQKIEDYYREVDFSKRLVDPYKLFPREEVDRLSQLGGFEEPAQARDFNNAQERMLYRHLPRFPQQRNFRELSAE